MDEVELRTMMEELGIPPDKAEELLLVITEHKNKEVYDKARGFSVEEIAALQEKIENESDWRKKAAKAARLISIKMESDYE